MCGHICEIVCHKTDRGHKKEFKCMKLCQKSCTQNHPCSKLCGEPCHPCLVSELKTFPGIFFQKQCFRRKSMSE